LILYILTAGTERFFRQSCIYLLDVIKACKSLSIIIPVTRLGSNRVYRFQERAYSLRSATSSRSGSGRR
jgi:hypothetical protein